MRRPPQQFRHSAFGSMTPMIDVVFLLLIFFVVTASTQIRELLLPADLAATGSVETPQPPEAKDPLIVEVTLKLTVSPETGRTTVDMNGTPYDDLQQLKEQLRLLAELGPENPVILDIAGDVPLGEIVDVYDTCQAAGFQSVSFAADQPSGP